MRNKYFKIVGSILIAGVFVFLAFGSGKSSDKESSSSSTSSTSSTSSVEEAPVGYHKGGSCSDCSGTGYYTHSIEGTGVKEGGVCAGCNGRGYHLSLIHI